VSPHHPTVGPTGGVLSAQPPRVWTVGALARALGEALAERFNPVTVKGEVSGFTRAASGHCYFTLKDAAGQLRCAMFRRAAQSAPVDWRDGLLVEVLGRLDVYAPRGDLQLVVEAARPAGQGDLFERFVQLKAALAAEGLFDQARKRPLPPHPSSIAVVTSPGAAALRDVAAALARRSPHVPVYLFGAPVQGDGAPPLLCAALEQAYQTHTEQGWGDVLLLVRGGGSLEDLWAFNDPAVVRCIARAPMPVVVGVGHETDFTLSDFVADLRAPTPTAAAELAAPDRSVLWAQLEGLRKQLDTNLQRSFDNQAQRIDRLAARLGRPSVRVSQARARLDQQAMRLQHAHTRRTEQGRRVLEGLDARLVPAVVRSLQHQRFRLDHIANQLALLNPRQVLQRGYTWLTTPNGQAVTSVAQVQVGQTVAAELADGRLDLTVRGTGD